MAHLLERDDLDEVDIRKDWLLTKEPRELLHAKPRTGGHDASAPLRCRLCHDRPPSRWPLARRAALLSRPTRDAALESTAAHRWPDAYMRYFFANYAMIGLRAASLSPNARAGRVDAIESTASGAHAPTRHFVAGLVP
jgi:hypothetical protein